MLKGRQLVAVIMSRNHDSRFACTIQTSHDHRHLRHVRKENQAKLTVIYNPQLACGASLLCSSPAASRLGDIIMCKQVPARHFMFAKEVNGPHFAEHSKS
jgi:CTP:molybdopterin cytidylyltransferase MocA